MDRRYNCNIPPGQGPEVQFSSDYESYAKNQITAGGVPMTPMGSRSSDGSSGTSSAFSTDSWYCVQIPPTPMSTNSPDEFDPTGSWVTIGQGDDKPTFKSLGWTSEELFKIYKFIVSKGQEPCFELAPGCAITAETPAKIYLDQPEYPRKNTFPCCYPRGCPKKKDKDPFLRAADLERHYKNVHGDADQKDNFYCDYGNGKCDRHDIPFTRKDHYRDHLKDFHKEDIGCAKRGKKMSEEQWEEEQEKWKRDRKIYPKHWRCAGCLTKNVVAEVGWECPFCKKLCEPERQAAREEKRRKFKYEPPEHQYETLAPKRECATCSITGWPGFIDNGVGSWIECPGCTTSPWAPSGSSMDYQYG